MENLVKYNMITQEWIDFAPLAFTEFKENVGPKLVVTSYYPETSNMFRALKECNPDDVKVVLLGMDPYHNGSATGLCFDDKIRESGKGIAASLRNILYEMESDYLHNSDMPRWFHDHSPKETYLGHLPEQGVLMINTALTVMPKSAGSHTELWKEFTKQLIASLNSKDNIIWILWGNHAKSFKQYITNETHVFIESAHPSPLSATRGFFGSKPFSKTNEALINLNLSPINW